MKTCFQKLSLLVAFISAIVIATGCVDDNPVHDISDTDNGTEPAPPDSAFFTFGGTANDGAECIVTTPDGGFAFVGSSASYGDGSIDVLLVKTDSQGRLEWQKTIGGPGDERGRGLVVTPDGGLAIVGIRDYHVYLIKTTAAGEVHWEKDLDLGRGEYIINAPGGGFAIAGESEGICIFKTDDDGNVQWKQSWNELLAAAGRCVVSTPDGGYVASGDVWVNEANGIDILVMKVNADGELVWIERVEGTDNAWSESLTRTSDGHLMVTGGSDLYACGLYKLTDSGSVVWERGFGRVDYTEGYSIVEVPDGGFVITGDSFTRETDTSDRNMDIFLARTDAGGNLLWLRMFGGSNNDYGKGVVCASDGGFAVVGYGSTEGDEEQDAFLILTDENGLVLK